MGGREEERETGERGRRGDWETGERAENVERRN
jgi:hypothetical protein